MAVPFDVRVEVAFPTSPNAVTPSWTDVTSYVLATASRPMTINRGRQDQFSDVSPSTLSLVLDNVDGRFTAGYVSGAYYPGVKKGRRIRVSTRYPTAAVTAGNFLTANNASFETDVTGVVNGFGYAVATFAQSASNPQFGTKSCLITWPTCSTPGSVGLVQCDGLTIGRTYTFSVYVNVPAGSPDVAAVVLFAALGTFTSVKSANTRISVTWVASATTHFVGVNTVAATAGNQCYMDGLQLDEGSAVGTFTTAAAPILYRFDGYVDQWPIEWAGGMKAYAEAQITATDRLARLGRRTEMRSIVEMEAALDLAVGEWPLGDEAGSLFAGETSGNNETPLAVLQQGAGGTLAFGGGTGSPTDSLTAPILTSVDASNGKYLGASMANGYGGFINSGLSLEVGFLSILNRAQLIAAWEDTGNSRMELSISAAGKLVGQSFSYLGTVTDYTLTSAATVTDNVTHHAVLTHSASGGTITVNMYLDGTNVGSTSFAFPLLLNTAKVYAGGRGDSRCFHGTLNHVAVYASALSAARVTQHALSRTTGFANESSNARISRLASYAGVATADMALETGVSTSLVQQDTTGNAPLDMIHTVEHTENGLVFMSGAGKLTFHARSHRYNQSAAFTLDASADELEPDLRFIEDDFGLANDVTVTRTTGTVSRAVNAASVTEYDLYRVAIDSVSTSDNEAVSAANWRVNNYGTPQRRCPSVGVDLAQQPAKIPTIAGADLGSKFTLTNLPSQAPAATADLNIEGYTESLGLDIWKIVFNASSATSSLVWQLDSASYSQLGTTTKLGY